MTSVFVENIILYKSEHLTFNYHKNNHIQIYRKYNIVQNTISSKGTKGNGFCLQNVILIL